MFDEVYWTFIDPEYYGPLMSIEELAGFLGEKERQALENRLVFRIEQAKMPQLAQCYTPDKLVDL